MKASNPILEQHKKLARKLYDEERNNPQSPYANKWLGFANGQLVVVADNLDELAKRLREIEPDPSKTFGIDMGADYDTVQHIWGFQAA